MKALSLILLALTLGACVLFLVLDTDRDRGGKRPAHSGSPSTAAADPAPPSRAMREAQVPAADPSADTESRRQSVEAGAKPEARATFEGAVIGEGAPIPGASVELLRHEVLLAQARTDARGRFRLESEPLAGSGTLRVLARGFVPTERMLAAKPAGGTVMLGNLRLVRGQRLAGRVIDEYATGIPDAELRVEPLHGGGDRLVARGRSGPDGCFEVADAPPGLVLVSARARGFGERSLQHSPGAEPLEIQLQPGAELRLLVLMPGGKPVVGAEVAIHSPNDPRAAKRAGQTDQEGRVLFEGLAARVWTVRVTHPEYKPSGRQVQATGAEETIECLPWPAIEGLVLAPGGSPPPPGTRVQALPASAPSDRLSSLEAGQTVGPDGRFRLGGLRAGDWRVRAVAPGFAPATSAPLKLGIEGDRYAGTIELQSGGRLVFALRLEEKPVVGAELELFPTPPTQAQLWAFAGSRGRGPGQRVSSGSDGNATLENLSDGTVWVAVYAEGCPPTSSGPHEVSHGPSPDPVPIELVRGARLQGRVQTKAGAPVARAQLRIIESAGRLGFPLTLASAADGRYTSAWLPPGRYTIEACSPDDPALRSERQAVDVQAGEQRVLDLTL